MARQQPSGSNWLWWTLLVLAAGVWVAGVGLWVWRKPPPPPVTSPALPVHTPAAAQPAHASVTIHFADVTHEAGIAFVHEAGATGAKWYPETIGSGVAFFDYDRDGWPDILLVNGTFWDGTSASVVARGGATPRLYRNRRDGTFEDVTERAGLAIPLYGMGLAIADYDNDGDSDVVITGYQRHLFLLNNGDGTFSDITARVGLGAGTWGSGAAFVDYDRDGYVDLLISHYVEWTPDLERGLDCHYGTPVKDYCPVRYFRGQGMSLYRNRGNGAFEDVTQHAGVASPGTRAFAPYILDYNDDQWPDIFVTSDGTPSLLYRNRGDGTFEEVGVRSGIVVDEGGAAYAGMGIDATYPKNDAQLCIAIGNFAGEPTTLHCQVRQGEGYHPELFAEVSSWAGIGRPTLRYVTFGLFFFDADLDGFEDLFMVNGHVVDEARLRHAPRAQPPQLFHNLGNGKFAEVPPAAASGLDRALIGRGAAYADYDGDGDLDIVLSQNQGAALLLRNDTPQRGHFLRVHLQGTRSNRDGLGTEVRVFTGPQVLRQMLRTGRSYYSQNEFTLTFGLADAMQAERVEILWPSGIVDVHTNVQADTTLRAIEGSHPGLPLARRQGTGAPMAAQQPAAESLPTATTSRTFLEHSHAGINAYHAQRYAEAATALESARALHPDDPLPYRYLADLYWRTDQHQQARDIVRALAQALSDAYFLDRLGSSYEESHLLGLAQLLYDAAVQVNPQFPSARYNLGRTYLKQGQLAQGITEVQEALRLYPEFAEAHQTLGMAFTEQGSYDRAITHLLQALELQPVLAEARNHLGRLYMAQGRLDDAIRTFQALVDHHPEVAAARHNLAVAYARQGRQPEAVEQFRTALRLQPDFPVARIDLATLLIEMGQPDEAIALLRAVMAAKLPEEIGLDPLDIRFRLALAYLTARRVPEAVTALETILRLQPTHAQAHLYLGRIFFQQREYRRAWSHARQAASLGAPADDLLAALGRVAPESR
jgi:tetratricopeptide (TPR) repeat protein